ncbi:M28 family peptidase, partial [Aeromonas schubertii]|uniref:M28 family peptidase n=1 Tax=Aeromonas schubertii TaxID=652 RepID=UPI0038B5C5AD
MAGLTVGVDSVGNIVGRREGSRDLSPVMAGSHVDTVPMGGRFDGTAGVLTALEAVMALDETGVETERPIALI